MMMSLLISGVFQAIKAFLEDPKPDVEEKPKEGH
jgi:hypothetical protein